MKQKLLIFLILLIVVGGISAPYSTKAQQTQNTVTCNTQGVCTNPDGSIVDVTDPANNKNTTVNSSEDFSASMWIVNNLFKYIGKFLMILSSAVLGIAGTFFDTVVKFSIIEMAKNIGDPEGVGGSITTAWATLRDIANMCFIFVLLFTAFSAMFNLEFGGVGKAVKNIIIVALLINFSLFFSKVVIDASNIVSVGFYNSIVTTGGSDSQTISNGYMRLLGLQTWNDSSVLDVISDPSKMLLTGVLSSVFMLLMTVILFISGVMFLARFIILIFLMILSPLAAIAYIIPNMQGKFNEWKDALINQSFFAPLFFALTWVVFKVASAPGFLGSYVVKADLKQTAIVLNAPSTSAGLVLNYFLVMGFAVAALVFSKQMASKTAHFGTISGAIGGGIIGGAAIASRNTLGRGAKMAAESSFLRNTATSGKWYSGAAKAGLWTANKGKSASFDLRASDTLGKVPGLGDEMKILGKAGGKGGFNQAVEDKAKAKADYAKKVYGQTDYEKEEFERRKKAESEDVVDENGKVTKKGIKTLRKEKVEETKKEATESEKNRKNYMDSKTEEFTTRLKGLNTEKKTKEDELKMAKTDAEKEKINQELGSISTRIANEREARKEREKEIEETDDNYKDLKEKAEEKKEAARKAKEQEKKKDIDDEELSEETQKLKKAAEKRQQAFASEVRSGSPLSTTGGAVIGGALGAVAGPIGAVIGAGIGAGIGKTLGGRLPDKFNWAGNKAAARKISSEAKGKSTKDKAADVLKEMKKEEEAASGASTTETTTSSTSSAGTEKSPKT